MSCQTGDYMVECCWRGALFYLLTARLSGSRTTPHGDMQGAAAASSSPRGRMSLPGLICWYFPVNCCHVAFPQQTSHIPSFALARRRGDLSVMAWIAHQEMRRAKAVEYLSLVSSNLIRILPFWSADTGSRDDRLAMLPKCTCPSGSTVECGQRWLFLKLAITHIEALRYRYVSARTAYTF